MTQNHGPKSRHSDHDVSSLSLIRRLARNYLKPYLPKIGAAFVFMAFAALATAMIAQLMQPILDDVLVEKDAGMVLPVALAVLFTFVLRGAATYAHVVMMTKVGQNVVGDIQKDLFSRFMMMDLAFFHAHPSGQLISRVVNDVNAMRVAVADALTGIGRSFLTLIFLIGVMFYQDWVLSIAALVIFPFAAIFVAMLGKRLRYISRNLQDEMAGLSDVLSQIFQGVRQVKAYGMEEHEKTKSTKAIDTVRNLNIKSVRVGNLSTPVNEVLVGLVLMGVILYGGNQAASGELTAGQLGAFLAAFIMAYEPMKKLARLNNALQMGLGATERVFALIDEQPSIINAPDAVPFTSQQPDIVFQNVSFQYENTDDKALQALSFEAAAGKTTALVGPSGGGKSTIINLIPRFYDVMDGQILVGGTDIRQYDLASLRRNIALVSQDITIFDDSAAANIAYSAPDATQDEIEAAARAASAHDFIITMAEGYQTVLGENGVKLSGGQRQRIAIARAILRNAPILLLDEATSALDHESEAAVQDALERLQKGRTTLVIAHRLSTVQQADQILVLNQGQVEESGNHETLLKQDGLYAKMVRAGLKS